MTEPAFDPKAYWDKRLGADWSLSGVGYFGLGLAYNSWLYRVRDRVLRRAVREVPIPAKGARVLDIGAGTGFYLERWRRFGAASIVGIDISDVAIANLRNAFPGMRIEQMDIGEGLGSFHAGSFDLISAFDVLFHIVEEDRFRTAIVNIHELLAPGGRFVWSDNFLHDRPETGGHQVSRTLDDIVTILADVGFEVIDRRPMFVRMNRPVDQPTDDELMAWKGLERRLKQARSERARWWIGAKMYRRELKLVRTRSESPTTEMMVCRRVETPRTGGARRDP